jgi:hypothetical protein
MIRFPSKLTDEDKIKFLYRAVELLRLEHNQKGADFRKGKITEAEWKDYVKNSFEPRINRLFLILNPIKEKLGIPRIDTMKDPDNPKLKLKEEGKKETKFDKILMLQKYERVPF